MVAQQKFWIPRFRWNLLDGNISHVLSHRRQDAFLQRRTMESAYFLLSCILPYALLPVEDLNLYPFLATNHENVYNSFQ
jgi:hypothetical protein